MVPWSRVRVRNRIFTRVRLQMCSIAYLVATAFVRRDIFIGGQELAKILGMIARFMIAGKSESCRFAPLAHFSRIIGDFFRSAGCFGRDSSSALKMRHQVSSSTSGFAGSLTFLHIGYVLVPLSGTLYHVCTREIDLLARRKAHRRARGVESNRKRKK